MRVVALGVGLLLTLAGLVAPPQASAHAELTDAVPAFNSSVPESPEQLELRFTEAVDPASVAVGLLDARGRAVGGVGPPAVTDDGELVRATLPALEPGVYTVTYQVVSAVDGHATAGSHAFLVDPRGTQAPPAVVPESSAPAVDATTIAARWMALAAALVAFGSLAFWMRAGSRLLPSMDDGRPPWLMVAGASLASTVGLSLYLALSARPILAAAGDGGAGHAHAETAMLDFAAPFGWTPFAIAMRVALAAAFLAFALAMGRHFWTVEAIRRRAAASARADRTIGLTLLVLLAIALLGMSLAGHAAAYGGPLNVALDWFHLLAAGAWLGALPAFGVVVRRARRSGVHRRAALASAVREHAPVALAAAPLVALTGLANSSIVVGEPRDLLSSEYGDLLLAKGALFAMALAIGAVNFVIARMTLRADAGRARVAALVGGEIAVAGLAVMAAAALVTIPPAISRQPQTVGSAAAVAHLYGAAGPSSVHVIVDAPLPGTQRYEVGVSDRVTGRPRDDVQKVFLTFTPPPDSGLAAQRVELRPSDEGLYATRGAYTPVIGAWHVEVVVRRAGARDETAAFDMPVTEPVPAQYLPPPDTGLAVPPLLDVAWGALPVGAAAWLPSLVLLGAAAVLTAWRRHARSRVAAWAGAVTVIAAVVLGLGAGMRAVVTSANEPPMAARSATNPVTADAASLERGRRAYLANCVACHGSEGHGDGPMSEANLDPRPLADVVPARTDGELAYRIGRGMAGTPMPGFRASLSPDDIWDLVNYLRARW